ncbi:hypothetical protein VOLCADRAFT_96709 [Volvox carteri f. nagariensis]|uniref:Uncharacterized protein n=1 Tax=Volvox carteri f. nagariensis TaxID=3068 RepID=D8UAU8_VOLCA|nr:uncharacterized protein VOLCADRAFT_96709 [Volvox carteri f. nagariensis]EFJ43221.1 hypothetical protein VOLCADRAFT_96709 [Volvox carteri f. nagariensis]|eukprot:XP_002955796.1 hypothetical protein VOLCADRAFT_96709 [Volvox carteri f. nagariensis]
MEWQLLLSVVFVAAYLKDVAAQACSLMCRLEVVALRGWMGLREGTLALLVAGPFVLGDAEMWPWRIQDFPHNGINNNNNSNNNNTDNNNNNNNNNIAKWIWSTPGASSDAPTGDIYMFNKTFTVRSMTSGVLYVACDDAAHIFLDDVYLGYVAWPSSSNSLLQPTLLELPVLLPAGSHCLSLWAWNSNSSSSSSTTNPAGLIAALLIISDASTTHCPRREHYEVIADAEALLGGRQFLEQLSAQTAAALCSRLSSCAGFQALSSSSSDASSQGGLLQNPITYRYGRGMCLYRKRVTTCPFLDGYIAMKDIAYNRTNGINYPLLNITLEACSSSSNCLGFDVVAPDGEDGDSSGWVRYTDGSYTYSLGYCSYSKIVTRCPQKAAYEVVTNAQYDGGDDGALHWEQLQMESTYGTQDTLYRACNSLAECQGFQLLVHRNDMLLYNNSSSWGFGLRKASSHRYSHGACMYIKSGRFRPGSDLTGPVNEIGNRSVGLPGEPLSVNRPQ